MLPLHMLSFQESNSSHNSFVTAREQREGKSYLILLSRVGDITLPSNYFDISVKSCSLYARTVLSVLHIFIHSFILITLYVADAILPICTIRTWSSSLFAPNHTVNGRDRLRSEALRLQNVCVLHMTQPCQDE